jgi:hypothetical protein
METTVGHQRNSSVVHFTPQHPQENSDCSHSGDDSFCLVCEGSISIKYALYRTYRCIEIHILKSHAISCNQTIFADIRIHNALRQEVKNCNPLNQQFLPQTIFSNTQPRLLFPIIQNVTIIIFKLWLNGGVQVDYKAIIRLNIP